VFTRQKLRLLFAAAGVFLCCWGSDNGIGGAFEERRLANAGLGNNNCGTDGRSGSCDTVTMPDGKMWLAENLNYKTDNSWCYDGKESNCKKYGRLYTWEAAKAACDALGWHLPSYNEWIDLIGTIPGGNQNAGKALKAKSGWGSKESINYGTSYYGFSNGNGTDDYGFSALPGGYRDGNGAFSYAGYDGTWWTAWGVNELEATVFGIDNSDYMAEEWGLDKKEGRSARCVKGTNDDRNGQTYKTVRIGGKTWMAENLNYYTSGSWCYGEGGQVIIYSDEDYNAVYGTLSSSEIQANCNKYGRLYTWEAAKRACQSVGMRLPSNEDWRRLVEAVGGNSTAGSKLKSQNGWNYSGISSTDEYGFSALPGGFSFSDGDFYAYAGYFGIWWTATEYGSDLAYLRGMYYADDSVYEDNNDKSDGHSVRCVKD